MKILSALKTPLSISIFFVISVGVNILYIFFENILQKVFRRKLSFGYPDILKINFVLNLKKKHKTKTGTVIK